MLVVGGESHLYLLASRGNLAEAAADTQSLAGMVRVAPHPWALGCGEEGGQPLRVGTTRPRRPLSEGRVGVFVTDGWSKQEGEGVPISQGDKQPYGV